MTTRATQGEFGKALRDVDLSAIVYKPPDDARTWKPCDFMVWLKQGLPSAMGLRVDSEVMFPSFATSVWFECKDLKDATESFPFAELRPSQMQGVRDAAKVGIPYWLAVYWRRHKLWTISNAARVMAWREIHEGSNNEPYPTSIPRELLMSRFGISSTKGQLTSTLKQVLLGEAD